MVGDTDEANAMTADFCQVGWALHSCSLPAMAGWAAPIGEAVPQGVLAPLWTNRAAIWHFGQSNQGLCNALPFNPHPRLSPPLLLQYWEENSALSGCVLVYNTGRSLGSFVSLFQEKAGALALPDILITAVGTKVRASDGSLRGPLQQHWADAQQPASACNGQTIAMTWQPAPL